ncbi:Ldh family oxidoreductase, partial [Candidatus Poribacteria bacterium]|nr:Ldh family oxidoreductase [Candidatus Poribacteria bacterium]
HGQPSVNPDDYFDGGRLLVFGGYKGYAFSLLTCLLGGLTGAFNPETRQIGGVFFQAISISAFQPLETYQQNVGDFLDGIRSIPPAPGFSEVLVPGDPERRAFAEGSANGIDLPEAVLSQLRVWGKKLNLEMEL